ncbi:toll/interleukin-1 receptor domain-containing protein [Aggregatilinea lenta]|uniref:toll/interleukin-1 receptor domain-containing protein n=1 Tax=Aggregatilinea lenta TaxID=913108 RepID=UPI000E5C34F2|nr:TIR domain-containing protein [Aggregatilinea lenta]
MAKIFVSYRRASWSFTYWLVDELSKLLDAEIFLDFSGIDESNFENALLRHLQDSDAVLLIVSEHTFDPARIYKESDWVRREVREAIAYGKPIALALVNGIVPPPELPEDIGAVRKAQGIEFYPRYFKAGVRELAAFLDRATPVRLKEALAEAPHPSAETAQAEPPQKTNKALLSDAIAMHEAGQYDRAVALYEQLIEAGYRPRLFSVAELRDQAIAERDAEQRQWEAGEIYDEIAALFRIDPARASKEYKRFRADYPEFTSDPAGLAAKAASTAPVRPIQTSAPPVQASPAETPAPAPDALRLTVTPIVALEGHDKQINSVAFSPDGRFVASGGGGELSAGDTSIRLWDVEACAEAGIIGRADDTVRSVAFSPDGTLLVSGSDDKCVRLWNVQERQEIASLTGHNGYVRSVAFSPDGMLIASGSADNTVRLWSVADQTLIAVLNSHTNTVRSVAFSPDGRWLATGGQDKKVRVWDVAARHEVAAYDQANSVHAVTFSPDSALIASGGASLPITLWDVAQRQVSATITIGAFSLQSLAFSPDGALLVSTGQNNKVCLWSVAERRQLLELKDHGNWVHSAVFSPDGTLIASGGDDKPLRLWRVAWE